MQADQRDEQAWNAARNWRLNEAELRINTVRLVSIFVIYILHLAHHHFAGSTSTFARVLGLQEGNALSPAAHQAVTWIAVAWAALTMLVHTLLAGRKLTRSASYGITAVDAMLLTGIIVLTRSTTSPLVAGYFLLVMMGGLRTDLGLVRCAAAASIAGYLVVLGASRWPRGLLVDDPAPPIPRYQQLMVITALLLAGFLAGQWVRHARTLAGDIARASREGQGR